MWPWFDLVTVISAGALIAPFAFLGLEWDAALTEAFDGGTATDLLRSRGLGSLFGASSTRASPLFAWSIASWTTGWSERWLQ